MHRLYLRASCTNTKIRSENDAKSAWKDSWKRALRFVAPKVAKAPINWNMVWMFYRDAVIKHKKCSSGIIKLNLQSQYFQTIVNQPQIMVIKCHFN